MLYIYLEQAPYVDSEEISLNTSNDILQCFKNNEEAWISKSDFIKIRATADIIKILDEMMQNTIYVDMSSLEDVSYLPSAMSLGLKMPSISYHDFLIRTRHDSNIHETGGKSKVQMTRNNNNIGEANEAI